MTSAMQTLLYVLVALFVSMPSVVGAFFRNSINQIRLSDSEEVQNLLDGSHTTTRDAIFGFDIDHQHSSDRLAITENVDPSEFSHVTGSVNFVTGDQVQNHDIVVLVRTSSVSTEALDRLYVRLENKEIIVGTESNEKDPDPSITIIVIAFIRPHSLQFGFEGTTVSTLNLDISIWPGLDFETYNMSLIAHRGTITGSEVNKFTAHKIDIQAIHGSVVGNWSLPSSIRLMTFDGSIDIDLIPKQWSSGPWTPGDVHAESVSGDISIRMPFERDQLSLRNGNTTIQTASGNINGQLVHGGQTTIISEGYGLIDMALLPYLTFSEWSDIQFNYLRTSSLGGLLELTILPPVIDTYYPINPLCLMKSHHKTLNGGGMALKYPRDWCGTARGSASNPAGIIDISGKDYEVLVKEPQQVVVQRIPLGSSLEFEVDDGIGILELY